MHRQIGSGSTRRYGMLTAAIMSAGLAACGSLTPTGYAWVGKPEPLIQEVLAGRIDPNGDYLTETGQTITRTPLCVLAPLPSASAAVDYLLAHGADVNKPCSSQLYAQLPADAVMAAIYLALAEKSPYDPEKYFREHIPANMATLKKLIQHGATNKTKTVHSMDDAGVEIARLVAQRNKNVADQLEDIRLTKIREKESSWFTIETLSAMAQVMNSAAQNYRPAASLPMATSPATSSGAGRNAANTLPAQNNSKNPQTAGATAKAAPADRPAPSPSRNEVMASANAPALATPEKKPGAASYSCSGQEKFVVDTGNRRTLTEQGWKMTDTTASEACDQANQKAQIFAANLPNPDPLLGPSTRKLKNIEACNMKKGQYDRQYALTIVHYTYQSSSRCDAPSVGVAR